MKDKSLKLIKRYNRKVKLASWLLNKIFGVEIGITDNFLDIDNNFSITFIIESSNYNWQPKE